MSNNIKDFTGVKDHRVRWGYKRQPQEHDIFSLLKKVDGIWMEWADSASSSGYDCKWHSSRESGLHPDSHPESFVTGTIIGFSPTHILVRCDDLRILALPHWAVESI